MLGGQFYTTQGNIYLGAPKINLIHIFAFQMQDTTIKYLPRQILITIIYQITALPKENCHQKG